jgi:hypothetical protein
VSFQVYLPNASSTALHALVNPVVAGIRIIAEEEASAAEGQDADSSNATHVDRHVDAGTYTDYENWYDLWDEMNASKEHLSKRDAMAAAAYQGIGANKIIASWLWSAKDLSSSGLKAALRGAVDGETQLLSDATMGVGTWNPPYVRGGGNAVNPAFRTAVMRPASELHWEGSSLSKLELRKKDALRFGASLRSLNPNGGGTYANEADPNIPNWQHAFWGNHYEKLLSIKKKVDPSGVFYCRACVGSELFEDRAGMLCRI